MNQFEGNKDLAIDPLTDWQPMEGPEGKNRRFTLLSLTLGSNELGNRLARSESV